MVSIFSIIAYYVKRRKVIYCTWFTTASRWNNSLFEYVFNFEYNQVLYIQRLQ